MGLYRSWVCIGRGSATVVDLRRSWVCNTLYRSWVCIGRGSVSVVDLYRSWICDGRGSVIHCIGRGSMSVVGLCEAVTPITKRKDVGAQVGRINRRVAFLVLVVRGLCLALIPRAPEIVRGRPGVGGAGRWPVIGVQNGQVLRIIARGWGCKR